MAKVSISRAAQLAGISRAALYKTYINTGRITVSRDQQGNRSIDTAELLRVFGALQGDSAGRQVDTPQVDTGRQELTVLEMENRLLKQQLEAACQREQAAAEREKWYQEQVNTLSGTVKLLEDQRIRTGQRWWWRLLGK